MAWCVQPWQELWTGPRGLGVYAQRPTSLFQGPRGGLVGAWRRETRWHTNMIDDFSDGVLPALLERARQLFARIHRRKWGPGPTEFRVKLNRRTNKTLIKSSYLSSSRKAVEVVAKMDVSESDPAYPPLCISGDDALLMSEEMDELLGEDGDWDEAIDGGSASWMLGFAPDSDGDDSGPFFDPEPPAGGGGGGADLPPESVAKAALDLLNLRRVKVIGLVFNAVHPKSSDFYHYRFKEYYAQHPKA